jgi:hypothetical protein
MGTALFCLYNLCCRLGIRVPSFSVRFPTLLYIDTTQIVVRSFIRRVRDFIASVHNFIRRVHNFILPEQIVYNSPPPHSTVTDFAKFLG